MPFILQLSHNVIYIYRAAAILVIKASTSQTYFYSRTGKSSIYEAINYNAVTAFSFSTV